MINSSGHLYVNSQCNSGVNLKKLVWPGRGWTFFILLWHGFLPVVPRARFFTPGNSYQYGILLLRSHRFCPASRQLPSLAWQNIISLFVLFCLSSFSALRSHSRSEPRFRWIQTVFTPAVRGYERDFLVHVLLSDCYSGRKIKDHRSALPSALWVPVGRQRRAVAFAKAGGCDSATSGWRRVTNGGRNDEF